MAHALDTPSTCSVCGSARTGYRAAQGTTCGALSCETQAVLDRKRAEKAALEARALEIAAETARTASKDDTLVAKVPYFDRPIVETPDHAKRAFRQRLRDSFRETFDAAKNGTPIAPMQEREGTATLVLNATCIACRGYCCREGAGHAFLQSGYLPTVLNRNPDQSPATLYREYARRIPARAYEDACLYQGEEGCVLPRHLRSWVCNDYECRGRRTLRAALDETPNATATVVAMSETEVKATVIAAPGAPLEWVAPDQD